MLHDEFFGLVQAASGSSPSDVATSFERWLSTVSVADVSICVKNLFATIGALSLVRKLTPNPPSVLDLADRAGYVVQLLYWYPLEDRSVYGSYDTEDIHSHFGYIATRALRGDPYIMQTYRRREDGTVECAGELTFREGMHRVVPPEEIHSVRASGFKPALSIRVVLPPTVGRMQVYDRASGKLKEEITCSAERRAVELAGLIGTLDGATFTEEIGQLRENCLLDNSTRELGRLVRLGEAV